MAKMDSDEYVKVIDNIYKVLLILISFRINYVLSAKIFKTSHITEFFGLLKHNRGSINSRISEFLKMGLTTEITLIH